MNRTDHQVTSGPVLTRDLAYTGAVSSPGMALASLLISVLAILIAIASVVYSRRQATASEGALAIDRERRLEERRPRLSGKVERVDGGMTQLKITLESNEPLAKVEITIPSGQGVTFHHERGETFGVSVRPDCIGPPDAFSYHEFTGEPSGMAPRESITWRVDLAEMHADTVRLEAICYGPAAERWDSVMITAPVEPDVSKTVW